MDDKDPDLTNVQSNEEDLDISLNDDSVLEFDRNEQKSPDVNCNKGDNSTSSELPLDKEQQILDDRIVT